MRDARIGKGLINGELCGHDGVVRRGKDGVDPVRNQRLGGEHDLVHGGAGALDVLHALRVQIRLRGGDGGSGGVLAHVVEQADEIRVGIGGEDEVHHGVGVEEVRGAGDVRAGGLKGFHQPGAEGIGHGGEDHGHAVFLGGGLHAHGDRRRHADHEVDLLGEEVCDDLVHDVGVEVAVVLKDVEADLVRLQFSEAGADVRDDLVEGGVVDKVADADGVDGFSRFRGGRGGRGLRGGAAAAGGEGEDHHSAEKKGDCFFHGERFLSFRGNKKPAPANFFAGTGTKSNLRCHPA